MPRVAAAVILSTVMTLLLASTAAAGPVTVVAGGGGASISAELQGLSQTLDVGLGQGEEGFVAGLCAEGDIHTSCTPAAEAGGQ